MGRQADGSGSKEAAGAVAKAAAVAAVRITIRITQYITRGTSFGERDTGIYEPKVSEK